MFYLVVVPASADDIQTRELLHTTYTPEKIQALLDDENHLGKRDAVSWKYVTDANGITKELTQKEKILDTAMTYLNLIGTIEEINDMRQKNQIKIKAELCI